MRDTDDDWRRLAETEPYYAVLTTPAFLRANLDGERLDQFFETGRGDIANVLGLIRANVDPAFAPKSALDFGCGVGRLVLAMADLVLDVAGVDVSPVMLDEARKNKAMRAPDRAITFTDQIPERSFDWVSSLLVLQHVPPAKGLALLRTLLSRLVLGGVVSLQFTAYRDPSHLQGAFDEAQYVRFDGARLEVLTEAVGPAIRMAMYDYDMTSVLAAYVAAGVRQMWLQHVDHGGHHAFWVIGRRDI